MVLAFVILATLIGQGGTATVLQQPRAYSSDSQLLYRWTFDGSDISWTSTSTFQMPASGLSATTNARMFFANGHGGSFLTSQNNEAIPGIIGQAFAWSGVGQGAITNVNLSAVSLMTVTAWLNPQNVQAWNADLMLIEGGSANWTLQTNSIVLDTGNGTRDFTIGIRDAANTALFLTKTCKNTNVFTSSNIWYFCAFVFDNTTGAGNVKLLVNTTNVTLTAGTSTKTSSVGGFGNHFWSVGSRGSGNLNLLSRIDDLRIYTNELTLTQISEIYTSSYNTILP